MNNSFWAGYFLGGGGGGGGSSDDGCVSTGCGCFLMFIAFGVIVKTLIFLVTAWETAWNKYLYPFIDFIRLNDLVNFLLKVSPFHDLVNFGILTIVFIVILIFIFVILLVLIASIFETYRSPAK